MIAVVINGLLLLGLATASIPDEIMVLGAGPRAALFSDRESLGSTKRCRYNRPQSLLQAQCSALELEEIPSNLQKDIKILDFSRNRLWSLKTESLAPYKSLAYLYLQDNFIRDFDENALTHLTDLQVLDLTKSGAYDFPKSVLTLPFLRKLYAGNNRFDNRAFEPCRMPEDSNLEFIELWKNELTRIPSIGILPSLKHLNVSLNRIVSITTMDLAPFCSLKILDLSFNPIKFNSTNCDCALLNAWIEIREIIMKPSKFDCNKVCNLRYNRSDPKDRDSIFSNDTMNVFGNCVGIMKNQAETAKARSTWIFAGACVALSLGLLVATLYCIHNRNIKKKKKKQRLKQQQLAANNANTELLNGNMPPERT